MRSRRSPRLALECLDDRVLPGAVVPLANASSVIGKSPSPSPSPKPPSQSNSQAPVNSDHQNYSHIRVAMLAFSGTPLGNFESNLLKNSVDLLIPNTQYLDRYNTAAPNTPQLLYSNLSNIYLDLYTDWLNYADKNKDNREAAFFHADHALAFSGDSGSSKPVTWFWGVSTGSDSAGWVDHTPLTAKSDTSFQLPKSGQSAAIGYPDKFREINFNIASKGDAKWSGTLEYAAAIDSKGNPYYWKPLTTLTNTTAGFKQTGKVTFDPPSDWKAGSINGSDPLFYVRVRSTGGTGAGPTVRNVLGADYVNAKGTTKGVIPAFDSSADKNHDGYLNDAEYARRAKGDDARFAYQSRLFYSPYGQMRFATNPSNADFRAWSLDYSKRFMAAHPGSDGIFFDNSTGHLQTKATDLVEPSANYANDYGLMLGNIDRAIGTKWVLANTSGAGDNALPIVKQGVSFLEESGLRPLAQNYVQFEDTAKMIADRLKVMGPNSYAILDTYPAGGSPTDPRTQMSELAYYYLLADPKKTYVMFNGGYEPATTWSRHWTNAVKYNVGQPKGAWTVMATGRDPSNRSLTFKVYERQYDNALVLYKPLATLKGANGSLGDASATYHKLPGKYRVLRADGTLGPVVTSVLLRNGEGTVLIKA
ncbi:hypothetical protein [Zavarzinella formosa]|uniref:hypothetical protein n=1 Tax=Zavarzinella formosa TaxID=360055 RepID=UPI000376A085|nr:hypothetical protein [Zavarzinella formosa]